MQQPKMRILATNEEYDVASLVRLDGGTTLRAFPVAELEEGRALNYVVIKGEGAELIFETN